MSALARDIREIDEVNGFHAYKRILVLSKLLVLFSLVAGMAAFNCAAIAQYGNPLTESGFKPFGSFDQTAIDSVNLVNFQLNLRIPLVSYSQRGKMFPIGYHVAYDSNVVGPVYGTYPCTAFGSDCNATGTCADFNNDCNYTVLLGESITGGLVIAPDNGFGRSGPIVSTADGAMHETAQVPSLGGIMTLDTSGYYDTNPIGGNGLPDTLKSSGGISVNEYPGPTDYIDPSGNTVTPTADTIGRPILDWNSLNDDPNSLDPYSNGESGTGWTHTTDFSNCTGPFPTVDAAIVSFPSLNNGSAQYKICYADFYVASGYENTLDYTDNGALPYGQWTLSPTYSYPPVVRMQSIVLPNLTAYTFQYDGYATSDAATAAGAFGDLLQITLPTGGTIAYTWSNPAYPPAATGCLASVSARVLTSRTVNANDGTGPHAWTYRMAPGPGDEYSAGGLNDYPYLAIVTDPLNNDTVHTFTDVDTADDSCMYYETGTQYYQGPYTSGSLLKTVATQYSYTAWQQYSQATGNIGLRHPIDIVPTTITTTNSDGSGLKKTFGYDTGFQLANDDGTLVAGAYGILGNVTSETDVDLSTGNTRVITNTYNTSPSYISAWLVRLLSSTTITGGSGAADTVYNYDGSPSPQGALGNQTSVQSWLNTNSSWLTSSTVYNASGMPISSTDPRTNTTTYSYDGTGLFRSQITHPPTNGVQHIESFINDSNTGSVLTYTDQNQQKTTYSYDNMNRVLSASYPDGGNTTFGYNLSGNPPNSVLTTTLICGTASSCGAVETPGESNEVLTIYDGLGRKSETEVENDPSGPDFTLVTYDALSRVASVTNPYRSTTDSTFGSTSYQYDALGRTTRLTHLPDNTQQTWIYNGSHTQFTDESGHMWTRMTDGFGRLIKVLEPNGATSSPTMETDYGYDALSDLTSVTQWGGTSGSSGARTRSFTYDSLSRLIASSNPETASAAVPPSLSCAGATGTTWTACYGYDADGNLTSKTDNRSITTSYSYDALNRILSKSYSSNANGTPSSCYQYDSAANGIGLLANEWTLSPSKASCPTTTPFLTNRSILAYDAMGRVLNEQQYTLASQAGGTFYAPAYSYDLAGNLLTSTDGSTPSPTTSETTLTFTNAYDSAGHLVSLTSNWIDGTHPGTLFSPPTGPSTTCSSSSSQYTPFGALQNAAFGSGLTLNRGYDPRLRMTCENDVGSNAATSGTATVTITGAEQSKQ
jgi:YD repeat-containing protein